MTVQIWLILPFASDLASNKVDLPAWLAQADHICEVHQAQAFPDQAVYSPLGRSRRGQVQREGDCLPCLESGALDEGITLGTPHPPACLQHTNFINLDDIKLSLLPSNYCEGTVVSKGKMS